MCGYLSEDGISLEKLDNLVDEVSKISLTTYNRFTNYMVSGMSGRSYWKDVPELSEYDNKIGAMIVDMECIKNILNYILSLNIPNIDNSFDNKKYKRFSKHIF